MTMHVNPLRLAVIFDGEENEIQAMAKDAVGQLAATAKGLGRDVLVKGAQTMDVQPGGLVNWSGWVTADAFDQSGDLQLASCFPSRGGVILSAIQPLAIENETLTQIDWQAPEPRLIPQKIDAVLLATARGLETRSGQYRGHDVSGISEEFKDMFKLREILDGNSETARRGSFQHAPHSGLVKQGTRIYSLATVKGVEDVVQKNLSAPTQGASFHGKAGEIKELVDAMAITLADPDGARARLKGNRFAGLLTYSKR